jgi:hypothetical protein
MLPRLALVVCFLSAVALHARQAPTPVAEPPYSQEYNAVQGDRLVALERQRAVTDTKSRRNFVITPSTKVFESIANRASPVRVGPGAHFVVRMATGDRDPQTLIQLKKLVVGKADRQIPIVTYKVSLIPGGGVNHKRAPDESIPVTINKYGAASLEIIPQQPLEPGEYAFMAGHEAQCFGVDAGLASVPPPAAPPAKPEPPVWTVKPVEHPDTITDSYEATLAGISETNGKRGAAQLEVSCVVKRFTGDAGTTAQLDATLRVQREMVAFPTDSLSCQGDGANGARILRTQLGAAPEETRNLCFDGELTADPKQTVDLGLSYDDALLTSILRASGEPLALKIRSQDGGSDALTATFQLPANGAEALAAINPCLKIEEAKRQKQADAIVVACPELSGQKLAAVDVLVGTAMKKLTADPENDIGTAWDLPKATKARPTAPKLTLACSYQDATGSAAGSVASKKSASAPAAKKLLPIPASAKSCVFRQDEYTNAPYGTCSRE